MAALTLGSLKALARLHRRGICGTTDELERILVDERDALLKVLGAEALAASFDVPTLVCAIDRPRRGTAAGARRHAEALALRLARGSRATPQGVVLPPTWLEHLVRAGGFTTLCLRLEDDGGGAIERTLICAVLREMRTVSVDRICAEHGGAIHMAYHGGHTRGSIRLRARLDARKTDALIVDLGVVPPSPTSPDIPAIPPDARRPTIRLNQAVPA